MTTEDPVIRYVKAVQSGIFDEQRPPSYVLENHVLVFGREIGGTAPLAAALANVEYYEGVDYNARNMWVFAALTYATALGYPAGINIDNGEIDAMYPILVYIELPGQGQVSWHLPFYGTPYDGHDRATKVQRIRAWLEEAGR